jgi:hypothetical protein
MTFMSTIAHRKHIQFYMLCPFVENNHIILQHWFVMQWLLFLLNKLYTTTSFWLKQYSVKWHMFYGTPTSSPVIYKSNHITTYTSWEEATFVVQHWPQTTIPYSSTSLTDNDRSMWNKQLYPIKYIQCNHKWLPARKWPTMYSKSK